MSDIRTELLFEVTIAVGGMTTLGRTQYGDRRIAQIAGGTVKGPKVNGRIQPGGGDWILDRIDGVTQLDVRLVIETDDGATIYMTYKGIRHGPAEVMAALARGEQVDPACYYFRTAPFFETGSEKYAWMNRIVAVATGDRTPAGPVYKVYQVL